MNITIDGTFFSNAVVKRDYFIASGIDFDREAIYTGYFTLPGDNVYDPAFNGTYVFAVSGWGMFFKPFSHGTHTIKVENQNGVSTHILHVV